MQDSVRQKLGLVSQSLVYVQKQRLERKEGKPVVQTNSKATFHIITSL